MNVLISKLLTYFFASFHWFPVPLLQRGIGPHTALFTVKRNKLTSRRAEKLVVVHNALRLQDCQTLEYRKTPTLQCHVDQKESAQINDEETQARLIGIPLD